jgi:hypothetical protein
MSNEELDLLHDAVLLLKTANQHSHTTLWQDANRGVLARAQAMNQLPQPGALGELVRMRLIAQEFRQQGCKVS